jgi:FkbM family methyltransferase
MAFIAQPAVGVGWNVTFFGTYEPEVRNIFRAVLPPGGVALDIGANVGWHTLLLAHLVGDGGRVLAVEPNPSIRKRLVDNLNLNRLNQVEIVPYAIADSEGPVQFYGPAADDALSGSGHILKVGGKEQESFIQVETRRLDAVMSASLIKRVDLIKIDVEGFEWCVLKGGEQTIAAFRPHIVFEYDSAFLSRSGGSAKLLVEFFRKHCYRLFAVGRTGAEAIDLDNWPANANIWAAPIGDTISADSTLRKPLPL